MQSIISIFAETVHNLAVLLGLTLIYCLNLRLLITLPRWQYKTVVGLAFGVIAVGTLIGAFEIVPGTYSDLSALAIVGAAIFGGAEAAAISTVLACGYRLLASGPVAVGISSTLLTALLGIFFRKSWIGRDRFPHLFHHVSFGVLLALVNATLPVIWRSHSFSLGDLFQTSASLFVTNAFIYPLGLFLMCQFIILELRRIGNSVAIRETNNRLMQRTQEMETANSSLEHEIGERRQTERALRESEERFRAIIEQSGEGIVISDAEGNHLLVNPRYCQMTGYSAEELMALSIPALLPEETTISLFPKVANNQKGVREIKLIRKDGTSFHAEIGGYPLNLGDRRLVLAFIRDITERKQAEVALRESEEHFRNLVEDSLVGIVIERDAKPLFVNQTYATLFGYESPAEILNLESLESLYAPGEFARVKQHQKVSVQGSAPFRYEYQGMQKNGSLVWLETQVQGVHWNGQPAVQSTLIDITDRKNYQEQLLRQANYDPVTHLPNRTLAMDRLGQAVVRARRRDNKVGLLFIDLDQFKRVNDTFGHAAGDRLLKQAGERLSMCVRREDTVARLGGDEFTVILTEVRGPTDAEIVAKKIIQVFSNLFLLQEQEVFVTASIGITLCPDDGDDPQTLMRNADTAMYRVKEMGRSNFQFFTPELNQAAAERLHIEFQLRRALQQEELTLYYQPIIDIRSGRLCGVEALCRWYNPVLGYVPPERFIPVAEETGLIVPIGEWVLHTACRQAAIWQSSGVPPLRVSVNISSRQFRGAKLEHAVIQVLKDSDLSPSQLELEITESLLVQDLPDTAAALRKLETLGVRLSVDDFGTGYSSLSYLKRFPVDVLKIDKSFVQDLPDDPDDVVLVEAIIAMGHSLRMEVSAEGVETREQLAFLRARGCDLVQGFHFGKPLPAAEFTEHFKDWMLRDWLRTPPPPLA